MPARLPAPSQHSAAWLESLVSTMALTKFKVGLSGFGGGWNIAVPWRLEPVRERRA